MPTDTVVDYPLSPQARGVWAKSQTDEQFHRDVVGWLPLHQHLDDTAGVAALLWDNWSSDAIKRLIAEPFDDDQDVARAFSIWLAAVHDVGKISPAFSVQVAELADDMSLLGFITDPSLAGSEERRMARHELVSYLAIADWLKNQHNYPRSTATQFASILAAHHGLPPAHDQIQAATARPYLIGTGIWESVRREFLDRAERMHAPGLFGRWRELALPQKVQVLLSGLLIMADWIASDEKLFPYTPRGTQPEASTTERLETAWRSLNFPEPWHVDEPDMTTAELFANRFTLPPGATVRPVQEEMVRIARELTEPALIILEAEMGVGKTEAALAAAEILAAKFDLGGVFVALPTQATTDSMFSRVLAWAQTLHLESSGTTFLARGKSELNETYSALVTDAYFRSIGQDGDRNYGKRDHDTGEDVIAHNWFTSSKRGPLSNFVVGTIDQALFSALRSRHLMLRHLALAGKVVIIDEAHGYSTFMNTFLDRAVNWLGAYGVPVIVLSATLPSARRMALIAAYDDGRNSGRALALSYRERKAAATRYDSLDGDIGYPSITVSQTNAPPLIASPQEPPHDQIVRLERLDDSPEALAHLLREALRDGGCAAVIRNTVGRVQETARYLRAEFPEVDVIVAHSRFLATDRVAKDGQLLRLFGAPSATTATTTTTRPQKCIVVASQVIEQSLDIDFDLMVSDLAPMDLLFQRAGRLHRHTRGVGESNRPPALRTARLVITGVDWTTEPPEPDRSYQKVYHPSILYRTLAVLRDRTELHLPADIPVLVQTVYGEQPVGPESWRDTLEEAEHDHRALIEKKHRDGQNFVLREPGGTDSNLLGWVYANADDPSNEAKGQAAVRDSGETLEVLVVQRTADGTFRTPTWLPARGGVTIPTDLPPERTLAKTILGCSIRLPESMCAYGRIDRHIETLERTFDLPSWHASRYLKGELALVLDETGNGTLNEYRLHYDNDTGLEVTRDD